MVTVSASLSQVKGQLLQVANDQEIFDLCRRAGYVWRNRVLNPAVTIQLLILQLLSRVALQGLRQVAGISVSAQAICKARQRLPLRVLMELVERSVPRKWASSTWKGLVVYLADGVSFMAPDTPELNRHFGKASNQWGTHWGYPTPKLLALMDGEAGFIHKVIALPWARQEFTCLSRLLKAMGRNALLLGDRGLVSFAHLALMMQAGIHGCFRLPRQHAARGRGRRSHRPVKRLARQDWLVRWVKDCKGRRVRWMSKVRWNALPRELLLRQIGFRIVRPGYRTRWAWIVTTLLDPLAYPAQDLIDLYTRRWQIEVYFRDLKQSLGMAQLSSRSVSAVRKEIAAFVLLYNLVRRAMQTSAQMQSVSPDRISFGDALNWLLWSSPGSMVPKLNINPRRVRNGSLRRLKKHFRRYPPMYKPREYYSQPRCTAVL
jgi:hypothetical protein